MGLDGGRGSTTNDEADLLELAAALARRAAAAVMAVRAAGGVAVERKADSSPVTAADRLAEAVILGGLRAARPDIPAISEEAVAAGTAPVAPGEGGRWWLVDPLDGTREFAAGLDEFAICIGLVARGRTRLGVVVAPATGEEFGGIVGVGAWKEDGAGRRPICARVPPAEGPVAVVSRHHGDEARLMDFLAACGVGRVVRGGSALKFCRIAEGAADLYPRFGRTMEWDTAAPHAVPEAAGGASRTLGGGGLRCDEPGFKNPLSVCRGLARPDRDPRSTVPPLGARRL